MKQEKEKGKRVEKGKSCAILSLKKRTLLAHQEVRCAQAKRVFRQKYVRKMAFGSKYWHVVGRGGRLSLIAVLSITDFP